MPEPVPAPVEIPAEFRIDVPHIVDAADVLAHLDSTPDGLTTDEAARRRDVLGDNDLPIGESRSIPSMLLDQFKDFLILLLLGAAVVSGLLGEAADTIAILVIVALNAVIGVVQEYRAERAMEALREMAAETATVRRDGQVVEIPASALTVGDIVLLDAGRVVPADLRLVESAGLRAAEAALTGESLPVEKYVEPTEIPDAPLGDRSSMAYKGTQIVHGRGAGVVTSVGLATEIGKIASLLGVTGDVKTPLQKRLAQFGRGLGVAALGLCAIVFIVGIMRGEDLLVMFLTSVSLAVAAVPEALPAVATIALAFGARRLVKSHTLVRKLPAVETLGSVTYICTDKTGTLTVNRMTVERLATGEAALGALTPPGEADERALWFGRALALSNDVAGRDDALVGDPTEIAFYQAAAEAGYPRAALEAEFPRSAELPFDSDRKLMTTVHDVTGDGYVSFTKGAAEAMLDRAAGTLGADGTTQPLDRAAADRLVDEWSSVGLRVLAFGMRRLEALPSDADFDSLECELVIIGYAGLVDPPRPEAAGAVAECVSAGIVPVMITGDHPATALAIARRLGIGKHESQMITGAELEALTLEEFEGRVEGLRVYARVAPEQKLKIVEALQDRGEYVAMTGDGVNDAPAIRSADIGIGMGITGTDVSKGVSNMVLADDNFATIVTAVEEGRKIYANIRKSVQFLLTCNLGEIVTIFMGTMMGWTVLLPIHILWVNLVTDSLPALALGVEKAEDDVMDQPPRDSNASFFSEGVGHSILFRGVIQGLITLSAYWYGETHYNHEIAMTMAFATLGLIQLAHAMNTRSNDKSIFKIGLFSNRFMNGAIVIATLLQVSIILIPGLNTMFRVTHLNLSQWGIVLAASLSIIPIVEVIKLVTRVLRKKQH